MVTRAKPTLVSVVGLKSVTENVRTPERQNILQKRRHEIPQGLTFFRGAFSQSFHDVWSSLDLWTMYKHIFETWQTEICSVF
jgi:hypothetical protein